MTDDLVDRLAEEAEEGCDVTALRRRGGRRPIGSAAAEVVPVRLMAGCVFCAIVAGERPAHRVLETDDAVAFLDARPLFKGHTLLLPRAHVETLSDLPHELVGSFFGHAQRLATAMETGLGAAGSFVAMNNRISQSVPHLHVHIVPRNRKDGLRGFFWPRTTYASEEEAADYAVRLRASLSAS